MRATRLVPLAALAALVLAGCDSSSPTPTVTVTGSTPGATPSPSAVVTPSPTPTLPPAPAALHVTTSGILPLTIDDPAATNPGAIMILWDDDYCYSEEMGITTDTGRWIANYPDPRPFSLNGHNSPTITRIDVWAPGLSTPEGIHIGSTLADLLATYPGITTGTPSFATTPYWISDSHGFVVFEVGSGTVDGGAGPDQVWFMRVLAPSWDPDWAVAQSGNVADACF